MSWPSKPDVHVTRNDDGILVDMTGVKTQKEITKVTRAEAQIALAVVFVFGPAVAWLVFLIFR